MRRHFEQRLQRQEEDHLQTINVLRGQLNQLRVDHRRETQDLLLQIEAARAANDNLRRCQFCHRVKS